jgi:hypothetical protein
MWRWARLFSDGVPAHTHDVWSASTGRVNWNVAP